MGHGFTIMGHRFPFVARGLPLRRHRFPLLGDRLSLRVNRFPLMGYGLYFGRNRYPNRDNISPVRVESMLKLSKSLPCSEYIKFTTL